jgi:hypothetical protein
MKRDKYEIYLLELRQGIKDAEEQLRNLVCVSLIDYRRLYALKKMIKEELIKNKVNESDKKQQFLKFMEG